MSRATPRRPLDIAALFPELREHAATATRLHPRPGVPTTADSSIGGPLLWPADEPWPVCKVGDGHYIHKLLRPVTVHRIREILANAEGRDFTSEERAEMPGWNFSEPVALLDQSIPMVAVAQLYRHDIPGFIGPDDCDVLQVLWCPLDHPDTDYNPLVRVFWRRSADITDPLLEFPEPSVVRDSYLPVPCVLRPEQVVEFQYIDLLPDDLQERINAWEETDDELPRYDCELSLAPGWKVGGFADWSVSDPQEVNCTECGAEMTLMLTVDSGEWADLSWRPEGDTVVDPTKVVIGRGWDLKIFRCPVSYEHPAATAAQ
ncbi:hypothetical protein [Actinoplanes sp. L3-i22]|uniref:hypothetical protein n=1 Tax=Actinoplanes sp. L3-i22 TaxID=2836373 RepID=UPI001C78843B|nr:hypothetical protein [Actinoplanes sp. L3-i22]BCY10079.1 hypothetical protein L3i22_051670 [Actinoplanes sp. L3-i22]